MAGEWQVKAACRRVDPELFFPVGTTGAEVYERQVAAARAVCGGCPVLMACRAQFDAEEDGIFGGLTADERRRARGQRAAAARIAATTPPEPRPPGRRHSGPRRRIDLVLVDGMLEAGMLLHEVAAALDVQIESIQRAQMRARRAAAEAGEAA